MLQIGDEVYFSAVFLLVLFGTRSAIGASAVTASIYVFIVMFRFPQVPADQASQVLRPTGLASAGVPVVAHRAGGHDAPENTIAAIREASRNGATGVELDLGFTADGEAVLMHDETVDRTTNGTGAVGTLRLAELRTLDATGKHRLGEKFKGERVPTLQEAVEECINHQLTIFFDVKDQPDKMRQANPGVVTALTHRPWSLSRYGDGTPRSLSAWTNYWLGVLDVLLDWAHHHLLWNLCGVSAILMQKDFISLSPLPSSIPLYRDYVQYWAERGVEVVGWTINTAVDKQYYQDVLKISYITDSLREDCEPHY
ncbi:glycerophosphodiester phosphodiesterase 1 isoform X6 [Oncorhynchus mykiss]|uniref:glycerophosphodiester phosphodiesterase 1 isoform X6 n=1 Tax=Oncorhynchus mykiss TaxID=8022 RepID=UPI001878FADD|nr:glycerophosphodiester phosphodiesterase 1 isoform X6 [Oncorhynchus mykiss]